MPKKKAQKMKPSSAILPARYEGSASSSAVHMRIKMEPIKDDKKSTEVNNVTKDLENTIYSDDDTLSSPRSEEGTLTSDEVDHEIDSNSANETNLKSQETCSSFSYSNIHCSKSPFQISPTHSTSEKSVLINETFQISPSQMQLPFNCNSIINTCKNAYDMNNKNKSKNVLPDNIANNELIEAEINTYLYSSSEVSDFNVAISQTSDLPSHRKATDNCNLDDHTISELFSLEKSPVTKLRAKTYETDISSQDDSLFKNGTEVCFQKAQNRASIDSETIEIKNPILLNFLEHSKEFLNFRQNDIIKCLNYLSSTYHRQEYTYPFYYFFKIENQPSLQTTDEEMEYIPDTKPLSLKNSDIIEDSEVPDVLPVSTQSSQEINIMQTNSAPVVEKSLSNDSNVTKSDEPRVQCGNLKIDYQKKNFELVSVLEEKSNIECDNTEAQNKTEISSIDDNQNDDNLRRFNRIMSEVVSMYEAERMKEYINSVSVPSDENLQKINETSTFLQEKSASFTNSLTSDAENAVAHFNSDTCSEKRNQLSIPSTEELKKIIEASALLNISSPGSTTCPLNSPTKNMTVVKTESPDTDENNIGSLNVYKDKAELLHVNQNKTEPLNIDIKAEPSDITEVETESFNGDIDKTESSNVKKNKTELLNVNANITEQLNVYTDKVVPLNLNNIKMESPDVDKDKAESLSTDEDKIESLNIDKIKSEPVDIHIKNEPVDIHIKNEPPEIEEIVLEYEIPSAVSFSVSKAQPAPALTPTVTNDDEIEVLVIKKKKLCLQKTPDRKRKRDCKCECKCNQNSEIENTFVTNNHFNTVNISYGNDTLKEAATMHKTKNRYAYQEKNSHSVFNEDIVVKIENTDEFSCGKSNDGSLESNSSSKRTIYFLNSPSVTPSSANNVKETKPVPNFDSFEKEKRNSENKSNEPLTEQFGFNVTNEETCVSPTSISNNSSKTCFAKRRTSCVVGKNKKAKTTVKDDANCNISLCSRNAQKDLIYNSLTFHQKHTLTYAPLTVSSAANKNGDLRCSANRISTTVSPVHPRVAVSGEHSHTLFRNDISSLDKNIQLLKPTDSCSKIETKLINSSAQNPPNLNEETRSKSPVCKNSNEDSSKTRLRSSKLRTSESNYAPLLDLRRRGRNSMPSVSPPDDLSTNVLEWNANWFIIQKTNGTCFHIWNTYNFVKEVYEDDSEYYNTYFPLHLLNVWLRITESWEKSPPCLDTLFENQVAKGTYVKISLSAELDIADLYNWPKREDIVLCKIKKRSGGEDQLFGRICNVMVKDCNPSAKAQTLKKVRFELFCAEKLNVDILAIVKIQILINLRIALLQYDALRNFNSTLKHIIFNPRKYKMHWKFISFSNSSDEKSMRNSIRSVIESMTSQKVTVVHTSLPSFGIISRLATFLKENNRPVFIGIKSEVAFLEIANNLRHFNPILAIKKREVKLPEDLRQYTLEERSAFSQDIFNSSHVTLTLMTNIYLGDFTSVFDDHNLTCILHDAHLCTEVETTLLLYYGVKNLVLIGDENAEIQMYPLLKHYKYDVSLFKRFCKVKSGYSTGKNYS